MTKNIKLNIAMIPKPIFIAAPREMSRARFVQLLKHYLPKAPIVLGISRDAFVVGFEHQPQFKMLKLNTVQQMVDKVAQSKSANKVEVLEYNQSELADVLKYRDFSRVLLVNGSWKYAFHNLPAYQILIERKIPFKYISPFVDEAEAKAYETAHTPQQIAPKVNTLFTAVEMLQLAKDAATESFDYSFQTGVTLGKKIGHTYQFLMSSFNKVIPYQTYALHYGNARERHMSRPHDTNHYDTIHAEMRLLTRALHEQTDLRGTTLFINLLPCPNCARTLSQTDISEFVYVHDHSDGYAVKLLELCGKKVRRVQPVEDAI